MSTPRFCMLSSCTARPSLADRGRAKQWLDGRLCHAGHDGGSGRSRGGNLGERLGPSLISPAYHIRQSFPLGGGLCLEGRFRERRLGPVVQSTLTHAEAITRSVSDDCEAGRRALKQVHSDAHVQKVPEQAVGEGGLVRAGKIKDYAGTPPAECHSKKRGHDDETDTAARFPRREILAQEDGVARNDAALEQAEQGRDQVKRCEAVEEEIEQERGPLQARAEQKRSRPADAVS